MQEVSLAIGKTFAAILAAGAVLGTVSAKAIPTHMTYRGDRQWQAADPEDYPEIVAVTYEAMSGPYFAPRAYSAVTPVIRHAALTEIDELPRFDDYAEAEPLHQAHEPVVDMPVSDAIEIVDEASHEQMIVEDY